MSPRARKPRNCECPHGGTAFKPTCVPMKDLERIPLYPDELEALRLCDLDGLTQDQAGERMGVSRGTVQRILSAARKKTAEALYERKALIMEDTSQPLSGINKRRSK